MLLNIETGDFENVPLLPCPYCAYVPPPPEGHHINCRTIRIPTQQLRGVLLVRVTGPFSVTAMCVQMFSKDIW